MLDALHLIQTQCQDLILPKSRDEVPHQGFVWEVDVYDAPLDGVVLAEVELIDPKTVVPLPVWLGADVPGLPQYRKAAMLQARQGQL